MQTYTYYFLDNRDVVETFEFDHCASDAEARRRARARFRARRQAGAVEVWTPTTRIAVLQ